jgi:hypothetical protein
MKLPGALPVSEMLRAMARTVLEDHLRVDNLYLEKQLAHEDENKTQSAYNRASTGTSALS